MPLGCASKNPIHFSHRECFLTHSLSTSAPWVKMKTCLNLGTKDTKDVLANISSLSLFAINVNTLPVTLTLLYLPSADFVENIKMLAWDIKSHYH